MKILHLDSSILGDASASRTVSAGIVAKLKELHPDSQVVYRNLVDDAPMHLSDRHWAVAQGALTPDALLGTDLALGSAYMDELFAADIIVIGAPMYNYSISSQLKAWIDRVVVPGKTFKYDENGVEGLVTGKKVFIASSRGGYYLGESPVAFLDHQETYLSGMLGFIGLTDITTIRVEGVNYGPEVKAKELAKAEAEIAALAA
ncbi:FMN-dependent NADH-azoreductase [Rhizobium laguerreae]|uniref:FMN dependent NADH:quinone oxidoreductase n=1 Tax=Rhizobium laguerreae TaxID=1076926 RepID=A0A6N9ZIF1_9HYPH|nr:NAD(P)H-dependent oxidoreductase [Rhizobium laguerreae]NEH92478.1 FMN-dependent NADH-azoreductase [Rhizobium laguerreae]